MPKLTGDFDAYIVRILGEDPELAEIYKQIKEIDMENTFWLIENKGFKSPAFYASNACYRWMPFCDDVVKFETKADALSAMHLLLEAKDCIVTDHITVPANFDADVANATYGESYGQDWEYERV